MMSYNFTYTNSVLQRKEVTLVGLFYLHSVFNYELTFGRHFSWYSIYVQALKFTAHIAPHLSQEGSRKTLLAPFRLQDRDIRDSQGLDALVYPW